MKFQTEVYEFGSNLPGFPSILHRTKKSTLIIKLAYHPKGLNKFSAGLKPTQMKKLIMLIY